MGLAPSVPRESVSSGNRSRQPCGASEAFNFIDPHRPDLLPRVRCCRLRAVSCYHQRMLTREQRHAWFQVAFATAVLALLMGTDRNGDPFARVIIGIAAFVVFLYAILRLLGVDVTLRIPDRSSRHFYGSECSAHHRSSPLTVWTSIAIVAISSRFSCPAESTATLRRAVPSPLQPLR